MTALDSSSGAAAWCPSSLRVWPLVDSSLQAPNLSCLLLSLVWQQGHQVLNGLDMRARPPVGGLLVILHYLQEEMGFLFPLSRNYSLTNCRAQVKNDTFNSISSKSKLQSVRFTVLHNGWLLVCSSGNSTVYTECLVFQFPSLTPINDIIGVYFLYIVASVLWEKELHQSAENSM